MRINNIAGVETVRAEVVKSRDSMPIPLSVSFLGIDLWESTLPINAKMLPGMYLFISDIE